MSRAKVFSLVVLAAAAFALSACDRCGDPITSQNGDRILACKGDGPSVR
jgi:hypothetical protein